MRVLVGLSGGVDSSASLARLAAEGHEVVGCTLVMSSKGTCVPALDAVARAERLCRDLGVEFVALPVQDAFERHVTGPFARAYARGRTPNPCVACNRHVKVPALVAAADRLGAQAVATGHYVRLREGADGVVRVARARDRSKDQSYFLSRLEPAHVARLLVPLAEDTKGTVREEARDRRLQAASVADSQGVCFAPGGDHLAFLRGRCPEAFEPGDIVDGSGRVLGRHGGVAAFTVGQRRGLDIGTGDGPWFVSSIDADTRTVTVERGRRPLARELRLTDPVLTVDPAALGGMGLSVQTHHRSPARPARVVAAGDGTLRVTLAGDGVLAAPGQTCALYEGDTVVGGGIID